MQLQTVKAGGVYGVQDTREGPRSQLPGGGGRALNGIRLVYKMDTLLLNTAGIVQL
jgi:hypothetical protein